MGEPADLAARTAFPGRVRQFAAADPGHAVALAVGSAWCEAPRGGHAVAVIPPERMADPLVGEALGLARRLGLGNLHLVPAADPAVPCEPLHPRERQPVHLASLDRGSEPPWTASSPTEALAATAAAEPLLLLPDRDPRWGFGRASLLALAWAAGDGRRVVAVAPSGCGLEAMTAELALIGRMQLPLKLLVDAADLPWPPAERGLAHWWVACPDAEDAAGVLAWALAGEECVLAAMPPRMASGRAWMPGAARIVAGGDGGTLVRVKPDDQPPEACGALHLTSLLPFPLAELRAAAKPLLAADEDLARHLAPLAILDPSLRCALAPPSRRPHSRR